MRQKNIRSPEAYSAAYSEHFPLNAWPVVAALVRAAENAITRAHRARRVLAQGQHLAAWRGLLAYVAAARAAGTFSFRHQDIVALDTTLLTDLFMDECWSTVKTAVGAPGSTKLSEQQIMKIAAALYAKWGITGHPADGKRELPVSAPQQTTPSKVPRPEEETFLAELAKLLPQQPWKPGVHVLAAKAMSVKPQRVSNAIQLLIARGTFMQQRDGIVFDKDGNEVARDPERYQSS